MAENIEQEILVYLDEDEVTEENRDRKKYNEKSLPNDIDLCSNSETLNLSSALTDCSICLQACLHPAQLPCGHIFCFLCIKGVAYKNRKCALCRRDIPSEFLDHPQLVNGIKDICKRTEDGYQWYYEGRNGWWQYDDRTSQDIEEAFKKGEKSCTMLVAGYVYVIDFEAMLQQRQNDPLRRRNIKRDFASAPKKGVAGLRIDRNKIRAISDVASQADHSQQLVLNSVDRSAILLSSSSMFNISNSGGYRTCNTNSIDFMTTEAATDRSRTDLANEISTIDSNAGNRNLEIREQLKVAESFLVAPQNVAVTDENTINVYQQTLNDFHTLTVRIIDTSTSEDENDNGHRLFI